MPGAGFRRRPTRDRDGRGFVDSGTSATIFRRGVVIKMNGTSSGLIDSLNDRSREIFRGIVENYLASGEPVGSRTLSRRLDEPLSAATVRNVMADLEDLGLLYAPHTSAGRLPTEKGLRLFVDGLLEIGDLGADERKQIEAQCAARGASLQETLAEATSTLSGLAQCAGLVVVPKTERPLRHMEFVSLHDGRALAVLVTDDGAVENRVLGLPPGTPPSSLVRAGNYLNARFAGSTLDEARAAVSKDIDARRAELDELTAGLVEAGLAAWTDDARSGGALIVKGQARLLDEVAAVHDLDRVRKLFEAIENDELMARLLDVTDKADGVQIFIGGENALFDQSGCSLVVAPFKGERQTIVGAIGVIGPTRLNYARVIPMVDYTAGAIDRLMGRTTDKDS